MGTDVRTMIQLRPLCALGRFARVGTAARGSARVRGAATLARGGRSVALSFLLGALAGGGCVRPLEPIFVEQHPPITWPAAPQRARIRFVGTLHSSEDLKPARRPLQALTDWIVGRKEPQKLHDPCSVVRTRDGHRVWVADTGGRCMHLFDLEDRSYRRIYRVGQTPLIGPTDVCLGPPGSVLVCDAQDVAIHRLDSKTGELIESLRLPEEVQRPVALIYREATQEVVVVDVKAHDLKVLSLEGRLIRIIGGRGDAPGRFNFPTDIADDGELLWVADTFNWRIQGLTYAGEPVVRFGRAGDAPGDMAMPKGVALDSDGHVYVVDSRFENVQIFDRTGTLLLAFGREGSGPGEFWIPSGIYIDPEDRIWIGDPYNRRVQVFDYIKEDQEPDADAPSP